MRMHESTFFHITTIDHAMRTLWMAAVTTGSVRVLFEAGVQAGWISALIMYIYMCSNIFKNMYDTAARPRSSAS